MNKIYACLCGVFALAAFGLSSCTEDDFTAPNPAGIPQASQYEDAVEITVDPETNQVTFNLNATGVMPVWIIDGNKYSTVNGMQRIYAAAGDYEVEVKILNANGLSDGSIIKTFHVDNTIVDFGRYTTLLAGDGNREWRIDNSEPGHLGCGEPGTDGTNWWAAQPDDKASVGLYDNYVTFSKDLDYTFYPGESGTIYVNTAVTRYDGYGDSQDYNVPAEQQTVKYAFQVVGNDIFVTLPKGTNFPYIPNDEFYDAPRLRLASLTPSKLELIADNGSIAWHYTFTSAGAEKPFTGFDYNSEFNLWKKATIQDPSFYYAPDWSQLPDPAWTHEGSAWTFSFPNATFSQWQAQVFLVTDIQASEAINYDFSAVFNTSTDHNGITVKLHKLNADGTPDDGVALFQEQIKTKAYEDYVFYLTDLPGFDAPGLRLVLDFGGNADNTEVVIKNIVLKDHANDDGTVLPSTDPEDPVEDVVWYEDAPANLWRSCTFNTTYYYAPGWSQLPDPDMTIDGYTYTLSFPSATFDQWQNQVHFHTDMVTTSATNYDFRCIINSNNDINGVTVKLTKDGNDDFFYFAERVNVTAYEDCVFKMINMEGLDMDGINLVFDFAGNPDNTEVTISGIVLQEHAKPIEWNVDDPANLWSGAADNVSWYYAPGWSQLPDPTLTHEGTKYAFNLPSATSDRWQAQMMLHTGLVTSADHKYSFHCVLNSSASFKIMVKLTMETDDGIFYFADEVDVNAYEDYSFDRTMMDGIDIDNVKLVFDFGGNPDNCDIEVRDIILLQH